MTREGAGLTLDRTQLIGSLFALIPVPVAVVDSRGRLILSNSAFADIFSGVQNIDSVPHHELEVPGHGTYELETVPLNDQGMKIVFAQEITNEVQLRRQAVHLEKMAAIKTFVQNGRIHLTVTDNGSGIHARDMARIFDPFFTTKDRQRGLGLGLSICSEIVEEHGGELYAWSTYGSGSTFTLELPIRPEIAPEAVEPARSFEGVCLKGKQILVIDDEIHITELIFDVLTRQGARIDLAHSGMEALEQIKKKNYDVIICDQRMPGVSGQRLYRLVESWNAELRHRFLFVTGDVIGAQTGRFFAQVGVQYLRKPFRIHELLDAIEGLINRSQPLGS
ncbi:MAG: hypothetical protein AUH28_10425 [Acidobacteria bacterium 13_1_40CM_56_16]|nr:MAG: hypothetical protein AUH28_10425 [Acidobacteria bacterium 13_1_40CM_56_16]